MSSGQPFEYYDKVVILTRRRERKGYRIGLGGIKREDRAVLINVQFPGN